MQKGRLNAFQTAFLYPHGLFPYRVGGRFEAV
jgi:hypothetical protein